MFSSHWEISEWADQISQMLIIHVSKHIIVDVCLVSRRHDDSEGERSLRRVDVQLERGAGVRAQDKRSLSDATEARHRQAGPCQSRPGQYSTLADCADVDKVTGWCCVSHRPFIQSLQQTTHTEIDHTQSRPNSQRDSLSQATEQDYTQRQTQREREREHTQCRPHTEQSKHRETVSYEQCLEVSARWQRCQRASVTVQPSRHQNKFLCDIVTPT